LVLEVVPQRYPDQDGNVKQNVRISFNKQLKPPLHVGTGVLGTTNKSGSDKNANLYYGVFFIEDPGPNPSEEKDETLRSEKMLARKIIDHIRKLDIYKKTPQENKYIVTGRLIELNWDPRELGAMENQIVVPGANRPMGRPNQGAPEDGRASAPPAKGSQMGRKAVAA
jgi:hypothetical protein